jgi:hypothetical protein
MTGGNQNNPLHHRSDDDQDGRIQQNSKKLKTPDSTNKLFQGLQTTQTGTQSGPSGTGTSNVYRPSQGLHGMKAKAHQQPTGQDSEDLNMLDKDEWHQVVRTKERFFAAVVMLEMLHGTTVREKRQELEEFMVEKQVHCTEGPTKIMFESGEAAFRIAVETEEELQRLLDVIVEGEDETGVLTQETMFTRMDNKSRESALERTVEVYGLHPRTPEFRMQSAMSRFGEVEKINTRPCSKGIKITAQVVFRNSEDVRKIKEAGLSSVFVGKDLARLRKVGGDMVDWELRYVAKLSCLPLGTTALDLQSLLGQDKANFLTVPKFFIQAGKQTRHQREAFVYFPSEEVKEKMTATPVKIGEIEAQWGNTDEKRCRQCGKVGHLQRECEIYKEVMKTKEHVKMVREYQKGGALRVTSERSFAQMATGMNQKAAKATPTNTESKTNTSDATKLNTAVDKKINMLTDTINRLQEQQQQMAAMNRVLMQLVITMMSNNMGMTLPAELLVAAGLSPDVSRNVQKGKNKNEGKGVQMEGIPPTNESIAGIMSLISKNKGSPTNQHANTQIASHGPQTQTRLSNE